jgi:hypothetical protein
MSRLKDALSAAEWLWTMPEPHPLADLLPAMSEAEYAELRDSIRENGLRQPITLHHDGRLLDGRHRARICAELGIEPDTETFEGTDSEALAYVLDLNLTRRHLSESQRAMIAARLATLGRGRPINTARAAITQSDAVQTSDPGGQRAKRPRPPGDQPRQAMPEATSVAR